LNANITKSSKLLSANDGKFTLNRLQDESIQEKLSEDEEEQQEEPEEEDIAPSKSSKRKLKTRKFKKNVIIIRNLFKAAIPLNSSKQCQKVVCGR
jgi:hypothetical protein